MSPNTFLTIYIPTFNRALILERNLGILMPFLQLFASTTKRGIKVLVSDNASTDDTPLVATSFNSEFFAYHRNSENIGALKNFNQSFDLCDSDYIWVLGDDDFIVTKYMENVLEALSIYEPDLLFLAALHEGSSKREHLTRVCSLESLFLSERLTSLGHISRLIYKKSYLSSLPSLDKISSEYSVWTWIAPATCRPDQLRVVSCSFPLIAATKDGGMGEWSRRTPLPRLLELEEYIRRVATSKSALARMYKLNFLGHGFPFRAVVLKALVLRPDKLNEIRDFVSRCSSILAENSHFLLPLKAALLLPSGFWSFASWLILKRAGLALS